VLGEIKYTKNKEYIELKILAQFSIYKFVIVIKVKNIIM
jgi:hypothetical protein